MLLHLVKLCCTPWAIQSSSAVWNIHKKCSQMISLTFQSWSLKKHNFQDVDIKFPLPKKLLVDSNLWQQCQIWHLIRNLGYHRLPKLWQHIVIGLAVWLCQFAYCFPWDWLTLISLFVQFIIHMYKEWQTLIV